MSQDAMHVEADLRDMGESARDQTMEYTLDSGWKADRDEPLVRPHWIDVSPESGTLLVQLKGLRAKLGPKHFLTVDFSKPRNHIPLRMDLDVIRSMVTEKKAVNNAFNIAACGPSLNILVPTPPLYCLLRSCGLETDPATADRLPPVIGANSLIMRYILIKEMLLGDKDIHRERRLDALNLYKRAEEQILGQTSERAFAPWMLRNFERFNQQMNSELIHTAQGEEEERALLEMSRILCAATISIIRNLENCILMLLDKDLDHSVKPPKDLLCESQILRVQDIPEPARETAKRDLETDLSWFMPFRLKFMQMFYEVAPFPIPERISLDSGTIPDYPISIHALKLHCATLFMADEFEKREAAKAGPRTAASLKTNKSKN